MCIFDIHFSPDGKYLATGSGDKQIRIWDIVKQHIHGVFVGHQQEVYSLRFSPDGRFIVSGSEDGTVRIWDIVGETSEALEILHNNCAVTSVAISPNRQIVAARCVDDTIRIWSIKTQVLVEQLCGHRDFVWSIAFTPDGKRLISGSLDKTLKCWDVSSLVVGGAKANNEGVNEGLASGPGRVARKDNGKGSQCIMNFTGHKNHVYSVTVSHDDRWVASGSLDRSVQLWNSQTGMVQCRIQGHKNSVLSIDLSPAGLLATGGGDRQVRIWHYTTI